MQQVDEELEEIEQLILLQQQKLSLLRQKKQLQNDMKLEREGDTEVDDIPTPYSSNDIELTKTPREEVNNDLHTKVSATASKLSQNIKGNTDRHSEYAPQEVNQFKGIVAPINRMSYLSTELANERTLLAWTRTALAMFRTVFSFYDFEGKNLFGDVTQRICLVLITLLAGATFWNGFRRFNVVEDRIFALDPQRKPLGRPSLRPYMGTLFFVFVAVMIAVCYRGWWIKV